MRLLNIDNHYNEIILFTRDKDGNQIIKKDKSFMHYYYEPDPTGNRISIDGTRLRRLYCEKYWEVKKQASSKSYESDIAYKKRYILDKVPSFESCKYRVVSCDIEVKTPKLPQPMKDKEAPYPLSCITTHDNFTDEIKVFFLLDYKSEHELVEDFVSYIQSIKPDIMGGWNWNNFDYPYLHFRIPDFAERISPIGLSRWSPDGINKPSGISQIDFMSLYKKLTINKKDSYALDAFLEDVIGLKRDFADTDFENDLEKVRDKNISDVRDMVKGLKKINLLASMNETRLFSQCEFEDLQPDAYGANFQSNNTKVWDMLILKEANAKNIILPNKIKRDFLQRQEIKKQKLVDGAYRETFHYGRFKNLTKYDLSGAYPAMVLAFCLSPENLFEKSQEKSIKIEVYRRQCAVCRETTYKEKICENCGNKGEFYKNLYYVQDPTAILCSAFEKPLIKKAELKDYREGLNPETQEEEYLQASAEYDSFKGLVNSGYGATACIDFRLFDPRIANTITYLVRDLLHYVRDCLQKRGTEIVFMDTDSCPKDTPIFIQEKNKEVSYIPIEDLFKSPLTNTMTRFDLSKKQVKVLTDEGWSKINYVYRHKTKKNMYRIFTRQSFVEVSEDHSLIINGKSISPKLLKVGDEIDMIPYDLPKNKEVDLNLCWLIGFFLAEGSCGYYKKIQKYSWHIDQKNIEPLRKCKDILSNMGLFTKIIDCRKSSSCYRLVSDGNNKLLYELFHKWCITKTGDKKIPSFIMSSTLESKQSLLDGLWLGDGTINKTTGEISIDLGDKCILAGICSILKNMKIEYSLGIRADKPHIIRVRILRKKSDPRSLKANVIKSIEKYQNEEDIYDIETENHHFCGGLGNVLLHNSVVIDSEENITELLNQYISEWAIGKFNNSRVEKVLKFDYEGQISNLFMVGMCRYIARIETGHGMKMEIKGIQVIRRDASVFTKTFQRQLLDHILDYKDKGFILDFIKTSIKDIEKVPIIEVATPAKIGKEREEYAKYEVFLRAYDNTIKVKPKFKKELGNRFYWTFVDKKLNGDDVIAFDVDNQDHVKNLDYDAIVKKNILNVLVPIFKGMNWNTDLLDMIEDLGMSLASPYRKTLLEDLPNYEELKQFYSARETKKRRKAKEEK